ncbi:MAG: hypothetical protein M1817_004220 [Caeruleum heppii]|nr:MAG: hypothetical protein M1817_004220 [Caeruleum heppii]
MALPTAKRRKVSSDARVINRPEAPYKARGDEENRPLEHENGFDSPSTGHKEDEAEVELDQRTTEQPSEHRPTAQDPRKIRRGPLPSTLDSLGSSIFNLEVEELLARLRKSNPQQTKLLDVALRRLKARIEGYAPQAELPAHEAEMLIYKLHHIVVPFPEPKPRKNVNWKVAYAKPAHINIIGGYALETLVKGNDDVSIDLAVTMPSSLFAEKDYLDYRYFHKRAYYLACLAAALSQDDDSRFKLTFQYLNGNTLHPVLLAEVVEESAAQDAKNFKGSIRIMPVAPEGTFPLLKTLPHRNCIRSDPPSAEPGSVSEKCNALAFETHVSLVEYGCGSAVLGLLSPEEASVNLSGEL